MPLPSVHFSLAHLVLDHWSADPPNAPFDVASGEARNAYFQGTLGPDMGLFPGGEPLISELAHSHRTGALTRALVQQARTDVERGFAWGWVTHVVADVAVHPTVNDCARSAVLASGACATDERALALAHSRLELGLDLRVLARDRRLRGVRLAHVFDRRSIDYLRSAYGDTYGLSFKREWLLRSHRAVAPLAWALLRLERLHGHAAPHRTGSVARRLLCTLARTLKPRLSLQNAAFLSPLRAPRSLVTAYEETRATFWTMMRRLQHDGLRSLGDPDLDGKIAPALLSA